MAKWTEEQKAFMEWLALPKSMRQPATQKQFSIDYGIAEAILSRWKQLPGFWDGIENIHIKKLRERLGELYEAMINHAIEGKHPKYMEMAFQLAKEQFGEKKVTVTINEEKANVMSTDALARRAYELLANTGFTEISENDFVKNVTAPPMLEEAKIISEEKDDN